jgi:hypothetical protein
MTAEVSMGKSLSISLSRKGEVMRFFRERGCNFPLRKRGIKGDFIPLSSWPPLIITNIKEGMS